MTDKLTGAARANALSTLDGWEEMADRDAITKTFTFKDFNAAFGWMTRVAMEAEKLDHHPEWQNTYRTVHVVLTTHSAKGLTGLDIKLAQTMDTLAN